MEGMEEGPALASASLACLYRWSFSASMSGAASCKRLVLPFLCQHRVAPGLTNNIGEAVKRKSEEPARCPRPGKSRQLQ